jgi:hypothetical protein
MFSFPAALPFDYLQQADGGERTRRARTRPNGSRVRRARGTSE